jgi:hypothetical protein
VTGFDRTIDRFEKRNDQYCKQMTIIANKWPVLKTNDEYYNNKWRVLQTNDQYYKQMTSITNKWPVSPTNDQYCKQMTSITNK